MPSFHLPFRLAVGVALVVLAIGSRPAAAQESSVNLGGGTFKTALVEIIDPTMPLEERNVEQFSQEEIEQFFGVANCACDRPFGIRAQVEGVNPADVSDNLIEIQTGIRCLETDESNKECEFIESIPELSDLVSRQSFGIRIVQLLNPNDPDREDCLLSDEQERLIYFLAFDSQSNPEVFGPEGENPRTVRVDLAPPPAPEKVELEAGESALTVSWEPSDNADIDGYQVLCRRASGVPTAEDRFPRADPGFQTVSTLVADNQCTNGAVRGDPIIDPLDDQVPGGSDDTPDPDAGVIDRPIDPNPGSFAMDGGMEPDAGPAPEPDVDAGVGPDAAPGPSGPPARFEDFEICSERLAPSTSSTRIDGLADGVLYQVMVVSIDEALNVGVSFAPKAVAPRPVIDFWEAYGDAGGNADGGYCFVATATFGNYDHPFVRILRDFRDGTLARFGAGRAFIRWYYDNSPALAGFIAEHHALRVASGVLLAPLVAVAAVWEYTTLLGKLGLLLALLLLRRVWRKRRARRGEPQAEQPRRRRRAPRKLAAAAAATVVLVAWTAAADAQPYWDEPGGPAEVQSRMPKERSAAHWNFELKFGPWTPNVDSEIDDGYQVDNYTEALTVDGQTVFDGPYDAVFGGAGLLTQLQFDRYLFQNRWGDLGVGGTIGYMRKSADALLIDREEITDAAGNEQGRPFTIDGKLARSSGDTISFNLMPLAATVVYRFTYLDTKFGVPVVPYARGGLSYYLWWTRDPSGNTAESDDPDTGESTRGAGGSFGFQGTVGLAVRLERIDVEAGTNLRDELGIEHASFFFEGTAARVDGFGSDGKLSVGDINWAAGMSFEF